MEQFLNITPGFVSVMGLMNDTKKQVRLLVYSYLRNDTLVDEDVLKEEYFGCHPYINTSSIRLKVSDVFQKFLLAVHHDYTVVHIGIGE